jgi:hypothetical protein
MRWLTGGMPVLVNINIFSELTKIFAHRLERHCRANNIVPPEQFAKSKSSCEEASLVKNLALNA